jgi:hypothetical protein
MLQIFLAKGRIPFDVVYTTTPLIIGGNKQHLMKRTLANWANFFRISA